MAASCNSNQLVLIFREILIVILIDDDFFL